jgi:hypothetical protein
MITVLPGWITLIIIIGPIGGVILSAYLHDKFNKIALKLPKTKKEP